MISALIDVLPVGIAILVFLIGPVAVLAMRDHEKTPDARDLRGFPGSSRHGSRDHVGVRPRRLAPKPPARPADDRLRIVR